MDNELIRELLKCQRRLSHALLKRHPEVNDHRWLVGLRLSGELVVDDELWTVSQHGVGASFTRKSPMPHLVVDMHTSLHDPGLIDAWRLEQFAESQGHPLSYEQASELLRRERTI